jgi:hypothetical protein
MNGTHLATWIGGSEEELDGIAGKGICVSGRSKIAESLNGRNGHLFLAKAGLSDSHKGREKECLGIHYEDPKLLTLMSMFKNVCV